MGWKPKMGKLWSHRAIVPPKDSVPSNTTRYYGKTMTIVDDEEEEEPVKVYSGRAPLYPLGSSTPPKKAKKNKGTIGFQQQRNHTHNTYPQRTWGYDGDEEEWWGADTIYTPPAKKKTYSYHASEWSNYNYFYTSYLDNDDNSTLIVKSPESYLTPTATQIRAKLNVYGQDKINRIKEMARVCYFKMIDEKDYLEPSILDGSRRIPYTDKDYRERLDIFDKIMNDYVPGFTPLEQAIHIHYKIEDALAHKRGGKSGSGRGVTWTFKRHDYADPAINSQINMNPLSKQHHLEVLNKISLIGCFGSQFSVAKEIGEKRVANSDVFRKTIMREYSQFNQVELYQRILPNFKAKFLNKELVINTPVQLSEKKQVLIVLLDYSGSMSDNQKQMWVNAFLIDRFRYVIKGEAEIYFSYFVSTTAGLKFTHIKNAKDVAEFWKSFSNYPGGGQTDIGRIVNYVSDEVKRGRLHNLKVDLSKQKPEILIINDGQFGLAA